MKKLVTSLVLVLVLCLACSIAFAEAVDSDSQFAGNPWITPTREHEFAQQDGSVVTATDTLDKANSTFATCTTDGVLQYKCSIDPDHIFHNFVTTAYGHAWDRADFDLEAQVYAGNKYNATGTFTDDEGNEIYKWAQSDKDPDIVVVTCVLPKSNDPDEQEKCNETAEFVVHQWSSIMEGEQWGPITETPNCYNWGAAQDVCINCGAVRDEKGVSVTKHVFDPTVAAGWKIVSAPYCEPFGDEDYTIIPGRMVLVCLRCGTSVLGEGEEYEGGPLAGKDVFTVGDQITATEENALKNGQEIYRDLTVDLNGENDNYKTVYNAKNMTPALPDWYWHEFDGMVTQKAPTCVDTGVGIKWCKRCGTKYTNIVIPALGHKYEEKETLLNCYQMLRQSKVCVRCGDVAADNEEEIINVTAHKFIEADEYQIKDMLGMVDGIFPATCEDPAWKVYRCVHWDIANTEKGMTADAVKEKHEENADYLYVPVGEPLGHDYGEFVTVYNPGEGENAMGYYVKTCRRCGKTVELLTEYAPNPCADEDHEWEKVEDESFDATCTEDGLEVLLCKVCGTKVWNPIEAMGHVTKEVVAEAQTCTAEGTKLVTCTVCGEYWTEVIPADGHTPEKVAGNAATCLVDGLTDGIKCSVCGEWIEKQEVIKAAGYHMFEKVAEVPATCTEAGTTACVKCLVCGEYMEGFAAEEIPAKGHVAEIIPAVAPTEDHAGSTEGKKCSVCGEILVAPVEIPANLKQGLKLDEDGVWRNYKDGAVDPATKHVDLEGQTFLVVNGVLESKANGLVLDPVDNKFRLMENGRLLKDTCTTIYDNETFRVVNGELDENANGLYDYNGGKFVFAAGRLVTTVNGLWLNPQDNLFYYLANGQVQSQYSGPVEFSGYFFMVQNGVFQKDFNDPAYKYGEHVFSVVNGQFYGPIDVAEEPAA